MSRTFTGWQDVAARLELRADAAAPKRLNDGQRATLRAIANRIEKNSVLVADEVGMGKTRIAVEVAQCVTECDGRVAILVPPGLGYQWHAELREGFASRTSKNAPPTLLRSLLAFLNAWSDAAQSQSWFEEPIVLLSHAFSNWRLGENSEPWRWALLPELYALDRQASRERLPRGYHGNEQLADEWVKNAAKAIYHAVETSKQQPAFGRLELLKSKTPWPGALDGAEYGRSGSLRLGLERAVGLGLGSFDLVVLDEAHKSRGRETRLSSLLDNVVMQHEQNGRRLAITATPVELDESQWCETLGRINLSNAELAALGPVIHEYATSTRRVRVAWRTNEEARLKYSCAARAFERALSPYVLRRDKREDPTVTQFGVSSGLRAQEYRQELEILIETTQLELRWKQIVCAAESLSLVTRRADDSTMKRLRLTVGNGHGLAALLDQGSHDEADRAQDEHDQDTRGDSDASLHPDDCDSKRESRAGWWRDVIKSALPAHPKADEVLFDHPVILAAVEAIEHETRTGEKVLVFGRFTRPMRVLVNLLNAREMLARLEKEQSWPRAKVHESERPAVLAALRQLKSERKLDQIDLALGKGYEQQSREREELRERLLERIDRGLPTAASRPRALLDALRAASGAPSSGTSDERDPLVLVARALSEHVSGTASDSDWGTAFTELMEAVTDRDEGDADGDGQLDPQEAKSLWGVINKRLAEEFERPEGGFARLMNGKTRQESRRMLQLAFNRANSFPRVLVAQSLVGREGLNLHRACRTVVLLHPEWNPGVVEQQIGRVDRVGSLWETLMKAHTEGDVPRIKVRPVVFRGTYDEHNWRVLRARWDDYRAQLHGVVVPSRLATDDAEGNELVEQLARSAPNFSPAKVAGSQG